MQTRRLGNSDLEITPIGFGAWAIGGPGWAFTWGPQEDRDSIAAIHEAVDLGVNWIDTAAVYGLGHSEEVVARALAELPPGRRPYVFTKCERVWDERGAIGKCLKAHSVRRECEASLRRLGVETIDLYQIHWPEPDEDIEEGWQTLEQLRAAGKVRWIGVSNFDARQMARARAIAPITSLQPPYSLVTRKVEAEILPYAARHGIGVLAYSPMASGLLTGAMTAERIARLSADDWRRRNPNYQEPLLSRNLALVDRLRAVAARRGVTPGAVAVAWVLKNPAVTAAIVGARRPGQLREIHPAASLELSAEDIAAIER
jgi:aryl-alcohol dehydrogenase-like predicted oxidoreductase